MLPDQRHPVHQHDLMAALAHHLARSDMQQGWQLLETNRSGEAAISPAARALMCTRSVRVSLPSAVSPQLRAMHLIYGHLVRSSPAQGCVPQAALPVTCIVL